MIYAQEEALGGQILFTGDEIADIIAFVHHDEEQHKFSEAGIPPRIREWMHHRHGEPGGGAETDGEELGHNHGHGQEGVCTVMSRTKDTSAKGRAQRNVARQGRREGVWGRTTALVSGGIGLSLISLGALADAPGSADYGHHGMMWGGGWGGMLFGLVMMLLVIAAIVAVVVLVVRLLGGAGSSIARLSGKTPTDILEERFARGEIDAEEFEERRRVLAKESN
jgi:putative membrane protein